MTERIGVLVGLPEHTPVFTALTDFGLKTCQLVSWHPARWTAAHAEAVRAEIAQTGVHVTAFWAGWPGPAVWDLVDGPETLGLVPPAWRAQNAAVLDAGLRGRRERYALAVSHAAAGRCSGDACHRGGRAQGG
jgi:hypothetical protein